MTRHPTSRKNRTRPAGAPAASSAATPPAPPGLVWVSDAEPGLSRVRHGDGVRYVDIDGRAVTDEATLARIRKLAIPPAYEQVWICARADGHLQATGRDARGRKQYRYHPQWQQQRGDDKFEALRRFGAALPRIRRRVQRDLGTANTKPPTRTLVLATLVRLLDTTFIRIGNEEYARDNASYGLTTLRARHAGVSDGGVKLTFKGKSGVRHEVRLDDRRVAAVVRRCKALPGQELFQYVDEAGNTHKVNSADVNDYLAEIAGTRVTAKDFRTWHGSVLALEFTRLACAGERVAGAAKQVVAQVAARLRNTVAVCRKSYIHPAVLALGPALGDDESRCALLHQRWVDAGASTRGRSLSAAERRLMALLGSAEARRDRPARAGAATKTAGQAANKSANKTANNSSHGRAICLTPADRPVANAVHRKGPHAKDLGFHDAQRAGRPPGRQPAARRAGDG